MTYGKACTTYAAKLCGQSSCATSTLILKVILVSIVKALHINGLCMKNSNFDLSCMQSNITVVQTSPLSIDCMLVIS